MIISIINSIIIMNIFFVRGGMHNLSLSLIAYIIPQTT